MYVRETVFIDLILIDMAKDEKNNGM